MARMTKVISLWGNRSKAGCYTSSAAPRWQAERQEWEVEVKVMATKQEVAVVKFAHIL